MDFQDLSNIDVLYVNTACMTKQQVPISKDLQNHILKEAKKHHILILEDDYN